MLTLNNLKSPKGAHRNTKRLGRGQGSGQGQQAGKGHKGQKARKSGHVGAGFEGGQMPLYRRLPKKGFKNAPFKVVYACVNLSKINDNYSSEDVTRESLIEKGLLKGAERRLPIKILAKGNLDKKLNFVGIDKFSDAAVKAIEAAGGSVAK